MQIEQKRVFMRVHGRVQGVFYRQSAREKAHHLGLTGWVKNEPDGTVTIEAAGDHAHLETLIAWAKMGPPSAAVSNVEVEWRDANAEEDHGFQIKY